MKKIKSDMAEQNKLSLCVDVTVSEKTARRSTTIGVIDEDGVFHPLGEFTAREVAKGGAANSIAEVLPELFFEKVVNEEDETELKMIHNQISHILKTAPIKKSRTEMSVKEVHCEVCNYIRQSPIEDCRTIKEGECRVRKDVLIRILKRLDTGWTIDEFVKALDKQGMLHSDKGRLQKWVTDSTGTGGQYRAYVFDEEFKRLEVL